MPVFITLTKCLLFNHIIRQAETSLSDTDLHWGSYGAASWPGLPQVLVSSGCFWNLQGCTMYTPPDLIWLPYFIYSHPFGWLAQVDAAFSPSWIEREQQQTGSTQRKKRVSDSPLKYIFFSVNPPYFPKTKSKEHCYFFTDSPL